MRYQIEHYLVVLCLSDMPGVDGIWNIGQLDAMWIVIIHYLVIRYHLVNDTEADNIIIVDYQAAIRSHIIKE